MNRSIFALLALGLPGCFLPAAPCPDHDAGADAPSDAFEAADAGALDAACVFPESCPEGCNPTPCGCATDNPAIWCGR
jgi:hypothetical protein